MGIFDKEAASLFTVYQCQIVFRDKLMGGVPKNPSIIEGWLRSKAGLVQQEEVRRAMLRTLLELGAEVRGDMTFEELETASASLAAAKSTNGFKLDPDKGLYIESRTIKAMIKEAVAVLYSGKKWGQRPGYQGKAARGLTAERVFISPDKVWLDRQEPDGVELFIGHVVGPKGPTSNLTYVEYCENVVIDFEVMVAEDLVPHDAWPSLWVLGQENGLGALRSQGFGRFDLERWEPKRSAGRNGKMTAAEVAEVAPVTSYV